MSVEQNIDTIRQAIQGLNERDMSFVSRLMAPGFVRHDLGGGFEEVRGEEGVRNLLQLILKAVPDLHVEIGDIFATEDRVAVRVTFSGTHQGELFGAAPTGKEVEFHGVNLYRMEDGKVAETWQLQDIAGFLRQIGKLTV